MRMIYGFLIACSAALMAIGDTIVSALECVADFIISLGEARPPLELVGTFGMAPALGGNAIDGALQNRMRHEANVSRRSAARHI